MVILYSRFIFLLSFAHFFQFPPMQNWKNIQILPLPISPQTMILRFVYIAFYINFLTFFALFLLIIIVIFRDIRTIVFRLQFYLRRLKLLWLTTKPSLLIYRMYLRKLSLWKCIRKSSLTLLFLDFRQRLINRIQQILVFLLLLKSTIIII